MTGRQILWTSIIISITFMSCDPGLINGYVVKNESSYIIKSDVRLDEGRRASNDDSIYTVKINPKSLVKIIEYGEIGNAHDKKQSFLEAFDTISISSGELLFNTGFTDRKNWQYKVINRGLFSLDKVEYILVIKNENFTQ